MKVLSALVDNSGKDAFEDLVGTGGGGGGNPSITKAVPDTPAADIVAMYARSAARDMVGYKSSDGDSVTLQPHLGRNRASWWQANGNTLVASLNGLVAGTNVGTPAIITFNSTNLVTRMRRISFPTTAVAGTLGGYWFQAQNMFTTGNGIGAGGFHFMVTFSPSTAGSAPTARFFLGLAVQSAAPTNIEPNSNTLGQVGIGKISTSNNLQILIGAAAHTAIDLGASFPADANRTMLYRASFYSSPNENATVRYTIENLTSGVEVNGTIATGAPSPTQFMAPRWWITNNTAAVVVGLDVGMFYIETDN